MASDLPAPPTAPSQPADAAPARSRTITAPPVTIIVNLAAIVIISIVINITKSLDAACYRPLADAAATAPSQPVNATPARSWTIAAPPVIIVVNLTATIIISIVINVTKTPAVACYRPLADAAATVEAALASPAWGCTFTAPPTAPSQPASATPARS